VFPPLPEALQRRLIARCRSSNVVLGLNDCGELNALYSASEWLNWQRGRIEERQVEIEFLDPGVEAFVFTFG
jgi:hypothetical protein